MDYKSQKTMTRKAARIIAKIMRKLFGYNDDEVIDPIAMIELVPDIIPNTFISIVENDKLDVNVPARCYFSNNNIIIEIKEEVYEGARIEKIGGYRMHIIHEISHAVLFNIGYTPSFDRNYKNNELNSYESIEWQAKAVSGEFMIPYDHINDLSYKEISEYYGVSIEAAKYSIKLRDSDKNGKTAN